MSKLRITIELEVEGDNVNPNSVTDEWYSNGRLVAEGTEVDTLSLKAEVID